MAVAQNSRARVFFGFSLGFQLRCHFTACLSHSHIPKRKAWRLCQPISGSRLPGGQLCVPRHGRPDGNRWAWGVQPLFGVSKQSLLPEFLDFIFFGGKYRVWRQIKSLDHFGGK